MKVFYLFLTITILFSGIVLPAKELPKGKVIAKVSCANDKAQTYAAYLPKNYNAKKKWPILYCFDPGARGSLPVKLFKNAAQKYGFIVVGSNNVKNGPWPSIQAGVKAIWEDTQKRFSVDPKRIYATGFSGGGRVATILPFMYKGKIAGVMAFGGAFTSQHSPHKDMKWLFYGLVGNKDPNLRPMMMISQAMKNAGIFHRVRVFDGGHSWPQESACTEAIEWMNIQAMKSGGCVKDEKMLAELLNTRLTSAAQFEKDQKWLLALSRYQEIKQDFNKLIDLSKVEANIKRLTDDPAVKVAISKRKKDQFLQQQAKKEFAELVNKLKSSKNRDKDVLEYIASAKNETDPDVKIKKQLILNYLLKNCFVAGNKSLHENKLELAVINLKIATHINPTISSAWYNLALKILNI